MTNTDLQVLKVSSKRIAEKTGKEHKHVIRDIRTMFDELNSTDGPKLDPSEYEVFARVENGQTSEILLNERLSLCLASGYSIALRMAIIDDWAEMKRTSLPALPQTFAEALRQLAESIESKEAALKQLEIAQPKIEFFDAVTDSKDAISVGAVAKLLGMGPNKLFLFLREHKIIMCNNQPFQSHIDNGHFRVIEQKYNKPDGSIHIYIKTLVFQKGVDYIRKKISENKITVSL